MSALHSSYVGAWSSPQQRSGVIQCCATCIRNSTCALLETSHLTKKCRRTASTKIFWYCSLSNCKNPSYDLSKQRYQRTETICGTWSTTFPTMPSLPHVLCCQNLLFWTSFLRYELVTTRSSSIARLKNVAGKILTFSPFQSRRVYIWFTQLIITFPRSLNKFSRKVCPFLRETRSLKIFGLVPSIPVKFASSYLLLALE